MDMSEIFFKSTLLTLSLVSPLYHVILHGTLKLYSSLSFILIGSESQSKH